MTDVMWDVLLVGVGAVLILAFSFAGTLWLLNDTVIPERRGDKPGD